MVNIETTARFPLGHTLKIHWLNNLPPTVLCSNYMFNLFIAIHYIALVIFNDALIKLLNKNSDFIIQMGIHTLYIQILVTKYTTQLGHDNISYPLYCN